MPLPKTLSPKLLRVLAVIVLSLLGIGVYVLLHRGEESTDDASIAAHVVTVSPKIAGYVKTLNVDDNQLLKAGDLIFEIDPTDYQIRRDHAGYRLVGKSVLRREQLT